MVFFAINVRNNCKNGQHALTAFVTSASSAADPAPPRGSWDLTDGDLAARSAAREARREVDEALGRHLEVGPAARDEVDEAPSPTPAGKAKRAISDAR